MNILPHKSWHVKRRDNIERVRKDEAKAAEEEKQRLKKVALAEQEHRTSLLRARVKRKHVEFDDPKSKTAIPVEDSSKALVVLSPEDELRKHVNFFRDAEQGISIGGINKDHEAEKKAEQEKYEKKIGLLTYLGQSSAESQTVKPWYFTARQKTPEEEQEQTTDLKRKNRLDPMHTMNEYLTAKQKSDDPDGNHSSSRVKNSSRNRNIGSGKLQYTPPIKTGSKLHYVAPITTKHPKEKHKHKKDLKHKKNHKHKKDHKHKKHSHEEKHHKDKHRDRHNTSASHSGPSIEQLRAERLRRESAEKSRTERFLSGEKEVKHVNTGVSEEPDGKYNSQFHPEIARQRRHKKDYMF